MTPKQYDGLIKAHGIHGKLTVKAVRLVLVDSLTPYRASKETRLGASVTSRTLARLRRPLCPLRVGSSRSTGEKLPFSRICH